jgi:hypothetical protein
MNRQQIEALPNDPATLKREIARQSDVIASYEEGKRQRALAAQVAASGPMADFEAAVFQVKADLEGLSDGSEDITDPIVRVKILRTATDLIDKLFAAAQKS